MTIRLVLLVAVIAAAMYAGSAERDVKVAVVAPAPYDAALMIDEPLESQAKRAGKIIVAKVTRVASFKAPGTIKTAVRLDVEDYVKGSGPPQLVITLDGGTVGDETLDVGGVPRFAESEKVLLLLDGSGVPQLLNRWQSKYSLAGSQAHQAGERPSQSIRSVEQDLSNALGESVDLPEDALEITSLQFTTYCAVWSTAAMPVPFEVNPANPGTGGPSGAGFSQITYESLHAWQALSDSYVSFSFAGTTTRDGKDHFDGFNTTAWASDLGAGTLGVNWCVTSGGVRIDSDTLINNVNFTWDADDSDGILSNAYSLQSVMEHERGHGVGMGHSDQPCDGGASTPLMCPAITNGVRKVIQADDQAGAASRYPLGGGAPGAPASLGVIPDSSAYNLSWDASSGSPIAYDVERGDGTCNGWQPVGTVAGTAFVDDDFGAGLPAGSYCFRVKALGTGGDSAWSNTATTQVPTLYAPGSGNHQLSSVPVGSEVALFGRNAAGQIWYAETAGGSFGAWAQVASSVASRPEAVMAGGDLFVFYRAANSSLRYVRRTSGVWSAENLGGIIAAAPVAAVDGQGDLVVVALNPSGRIYYRTFSSNTWSAWTLMSGRLAGQVSLVNHQGDLYLLGLNSSGRSWARPWDSSSSSWGSWTNLGGILNSELTGTSDGSSLFAFGLNGSGRTYYRELNGGSWGSWTSLGGVLVLNPGPASNGSRVVNVGTNASGGLWDQHYTGSWSGWSNIGSGFATGPETIGVGSSIYTFAIDVFGAIQYRIWNSSWASWVDLGGRFAIN